jgi:hypothetical protein
MTMQSPEFKVQVKNERPPAHIYDRAVKEFGVDFEKGTVFAIGDVIYSKYEITGDLMEHELVHIKQQHDMGVSIWWEKFFESPEFRLSQEVEAYQTQYRWIERHHKDRNARHYYLNAFAGFLSGPMYGHLISHAEAIKQIRNEK